MNNSCALWRCNNVATAAMSGIISSNTIKAKFRAIIATVLIDEMASDRWAALEHGDKPFNLVLLGETGAGKTSLVELLCNYAKQHGTDFDPDKLTSFNKQKPRVGQKGMESDTTEVNRYELKYGDLKIHLIDTPGFEDTRGSEQQESNITQIINSVQELLYVNCIIFVINGSICRLSSLLIKVIQSVISLLVPEIQEKIIVAFTNVTDDCSLNFELSTLRENFGISIPDRYSYILDNPYSKRRRGIDKKKPLPREKLIKEFTSTFKTLDTMLDTIKHFEPIATKDFGSFHSTISDIYQLIAHLQECNSLIREIQDLKLEKQSHLDTLTQLKTAQDTRKVKFFSIEVSDTKNIVCFDCHSSCHLNCKCFRTGIFGKYTRCHVFSKNEKICTKCQHATSRHRKCQFIFCEKEVEVESVESMDVLKPIENKQTEITKHTAKLSNEMENKGKIESTLRELLDEFQKRGSHFFFVKSAKHAVDDLIQLLDNIPEVSNNDIVTEAKTKLNNAIKIGENPFSPDSELEEAKVLWACGMLDLDHKTYKNYSKDDIEKVFKNLAKKSHPDTTHNIAIDNRDEKLFQYYNQARKVILEHAAK